MLARSAFGPRNKNSGRQNKGKRFPSHLAWLRKRPCLIDGMYDHVCAGKMEAHHVNEGEGGMGVKCPDFETVPLCSVAHDLVHRGKRSFEIKYGLSLYSAAREYAAKSPHKHLWERPNG
jgi:hypothetical protein